MEPVEILVISILDIAIGSRESGLLRPDYFQRYTSVVANPVGHIKLAQLVELQRDSANKLSCYRRRDFPAGTAADRRRCSADVQVRIECQRLCRVEARQSMRVEIVRLKQYPSRELIVQPAANAMLVCSSHAQESAVPN